MTALRIDNLSAFIEHVFRSKSTQLPVVRKLLLQCGMPLRDLFVIDPIKGTAVAKQKAALKQTLIEMIQNMSTGTQAHTRKRAKGGAKSDLLMPFCFIVTVIGLLIAKHKNNLEIKELKKKEHERTTLEKNKKLETQVENLSTIVTKQLPGIQIDSNMKEFQKKTNAISSIKSTSQSFLSKAEQLYNDVCKTLKHQFGKNRLHPPIMFAFMIIVLSLVGYLQTKKRTQDPLKMAYLTYERLLKQQGQLKADPILARVKDTSSYEDTKYCLLNVDQRLHRLCNNYVHPNELRYHLLQLKTKREWFHGRSLLAEHLLRNNGEVRTSCSEIALAIAYHWKLQNLMGIVNEHVKGTMRRKPMS